MNNFETIYKENYRRMFGIALHMIHDRDAAGDIIQDIFVYYHKISQNGNTVNNPGSWLMRATINKCIDYSKQRKKHLKIESLKSVPATGDATEKEQDTEIVKLALAKLKPEEKTLALLYGEGMSYREIAEITGIRYSSVGKKLSRTIKKLDDLLKRMGYEMYQ